jgi:hypothetical protein
MLSIIKNEMKRGISTSISRQSFILLVIVIMVYAASVATSLHYARLSADSTLYLNIAEKYIKGDLNNAINGYWGPMLSWLLIPFLYLGASHVFSINAVSLIFGVLTIIGVWNLSFRFEIANSVRNAVVIATLPIILFISLIEQFDLILLCLLVYYLTIIFNNEYERKIHNAVLCGILGSLAYFTKSYAFPFFLVHFTIMNVFHYLRCDSVKDKRKVLKNSVAGIITFLIISLPWILLISNKYDHFTISNMGKGNFAAHAPGLPKTGFEVGGPMFYKGFFPPPNETAVSVWEDPSYIWQDIESWSPLESITYFKYFLKNIIKNVFEGIRICQSFSRLSVVIVIIYVLILAGRPPGRQVFSGDLLYPFFTLFLYAGGYGPFHFETRYLWIINILLLLMGGYILTRLFQSNFFKSNLRKYLIIVFFMISFIITPSKSYLHAYSDNINRDMYVIGSTIKDHYNIHGKIASNREWKHIPVHDSWHKTFRLSYWLDSKYYGQAEQGISEEDLLKDLQGYNIDYFFYWSEYDDEPDFLSRYKEITKGEIPGLKIFDLKRENK